MSVNLRSARLSQEKERGEHRAVLQKRARRLLLFFGLVLILIGLTTIPLQWEIALLARVAGAGSTAEQIWPALAHWLEDVAEAVAVSYGTYPFLQYGTDWLAFAHIIIGIAFLGAARRPVQNKWVVEWGMIASVLVIPTALLFGALRGIPLFWRLLDCAFGLVGLLPLWLARRQIRQLTRSSCSLHLDEAKGSKFP
jgi:hypothetical protein